MHLTLHAHSKPMIKRSYSIFLILTILMTPIASAFSQCVEIDMSADQMMKSMSEKNDVHSLEQHANKSSELDCHSCAFHLSSSISIVPTYLVIYPTRGVAYNELEYNTPNNTLSSSFLRPPIANFA